MAISSERDLIELLESRYRHIAVISAQAYRRRKLSKRANVDGALDIRRTRPPLWRFAGRGRRTAVGISRDEGCCVAGRLVELSEPRSQATPAGAIDKPGGSEYLIGGSERCDQVRPISMRFARKSGSTNRALSPAVAAGPRRVAVSEAPTVIAMKVFHGS